MGDWSLATVAILLIAFAAVSRRLAGTVITPAIFFVTGGLLLGGSGAGLIELNFRSESIKLLAEATLTLVLFADASRINFAALRHEYSVPARLLGIGLPLTIAAGALAASLLFDQLTIVEALILGIILAPTDAALGQAVVSDRRLPTRISQGLNVESGLNDGICVPLLLAALAAAEAESGALSDAGALALVAEQIGFGVLGGVVAGLAARWLVIACDRRKLISPVGVKVVTIAAAALAYGLAAPLGGSGFIAAFIGGAVFGSPLGREGAPTTSLLDETGELLNGITFIVFGAAVLGPALAGFTWQSFAYAALSLTFVRMIPVSISMFRSGTRIPTVSFLGWFGPRGLASIVFAVILLDDADLVNSSTMLLAIVATITMSVYLHGLTAAPLTNRYVRWREAHPRLAMEDVPAAVHRVRGQQHPDQRPTAEAESKSAC